MVDKELNLIFKYLETNKKLRKNICLPSNSALNGKINREKFFIQKGDNAVLVLQMGKVGSTSICHALKNKNPLLPVYHLHHMNPKRIEKSSLWHFNHGHSVLPEHLIVSTALSNYFYNSCSDVTWKIITLVRDPVALQLASIFQNLEISYPMILNKDGTVDTSKANDLIISYLSNKEPNSNLLNWFDWELRDVFGVDVFSFPFDHELGYKIINNNNVNILIMQFEKINDIFSPAMKQFLEYENLNLPRKNIGSSKKYGDCYQEMKTNFTVPGPICDEIYNSKLCRHFYSEKQLQKFKRSWVL